VYISIRLSFWFGLRYSQKVVPVPFITRTDLAFKYCGMYFLVSFLPKSWMSQTNKALYTDGGTSSNRTYRKIYDIPINMDIPYRSVPDREYVIPVYFRAKRFITIYFSGHRKAE
jgi:hypothetical protein